MKKTKVLVLVDHIDNNWSWCNRLFKALPPYGGDDCWLVLVVITVMGGWDSSKWWWKRIVEVLLNWWRKNTVKFRQSHSIERTFEASKGVVVRDVVVLFLMKMRINDDHWKLPFGQELTLRITLMIIKGFARCHLSCGMCCVNNGTRQHWWA